MSAWRDIALPKSSRQGKHKTQPLLEPHNDFLNFTFAEGLTNFFLLSSSFLVSTEALTKNFEQEVGEVGGKDQKPSQVPCKRTQSAKRAKKRGGETSASFLNWSHRDPQGSPHRTCRKSDKNLRMLVLKKWVEKAKKKHSFCGWRRECCADHEERKLTLQFASRQNLMPVRGSKRGVWVNQLSRPCNTSSDALSHWNKALICILPRSWQLAGWIASCWPQIRLWMRPAYLSTGYWDPRRNKLYQCIPETPQPARAAITPAQSTLGTHTDDMRLQMHNLQLFTAQNEAILKEQSKELVTYSFARQMGDFHKSLDHS